MAAARNNGCSDTYLQWDIICTCTWLCQVSDLHPSNESDGECTCSCTYVQQNPFIAVCLIKCSMHFVLDTYLKQCICEIHSSLVRCVKNLYMSLDECNYHGVRQYYHSSLSLGFILTHQDMNCYGAGLCISKRLP